MNHTEDTKHGAVSLRTLERGLDVLDCFFQGATKLSLTEISSRIGLNPSTASRILSTLEIRNYITRNPETKKIPVRLPDSYTRGTVLRIL